MKMKEDITVSKSKKILLTVLIIIGAIALLVGILIGVCAILNASYIDEMEKYIDGYDRVIYEEQLKPTLDERGNYSFTTDEEFKVVQLTDVHIGGGFLYGDGDKRAIHAVASMIKEEKPDLVIVTGDISFAVPMAPNLDNSICHGFFKRLMENLGVYWTVTFGNHDAEKYNPYDRAAVAAMYEDESLKYCLFSSGPDDVFGECNHVITVKNSLGLVTSSFVMIDSNAYTENDIFGLGWDYDNVHDDQIEWYRENIEYYTAKNLEVYNSLPESLRPKEFDTGAVKSYMYMHIPPEEMLKTYNEELKGKPTDAGKYGFAGEGGQVVYSSDYPDNLFETVVELGSTKGIFFGHDHLNALKLERDGVLMSYGLSIDYSAYAGWAGYQRGCTVMTFGEDGMTAHEFSSYYSGKYDNLEDNVNMTLPNEYQ